MSYYHVTATAAILCGSFKPFRGLNPIQACAAGVAVVFGPYLFQFAEAGEGISVALNLLEIREWRERIALAALKLRAAHRGANAWHLAEC